MSQDFKLLGSANPVPISGLALMTQGLGFPLRDVDAAPASGSELEEVLRAQSFVTQEPVAVDTPIQVSFGPAQNNGIFDVDALGSLTALQTGQYNARLRLQMGRTGNPGVSIVFMRTLLNGVQIGSSVATALDDADNIVPTTFTGVLSLVVNDIVTVEIYRDSVGNNSGGVFTQVASLAGWVDSPSTSAVFSRVVST